jgi:hypothetical protein
VMGGRCMGVGEVGEEEDKAHMVVG